jgi:hypothetical protein
LLRYVAERKFDVRHGPMVVGGGSG